MVRRALGAVVVGATLATALIGGAGPAAACSCAGPRSDGASLDAADVAFVGDVVELPPPPAGTYSSADPVRYVFAVDRVYKGEPRERQSVVTARFGASCGLELTGPGPFLVFADTTPDLGPDGEDGELYANLCGGTRPVEAAPLPDLLGPGERPAAGPSAVVGADDGDRAGDLAVVPIVAGAVVLVALAGGLLIVRRPRRT
jgi:hypothetical protein